MKMVMTRGKDDPKDLYDLIGTDESRKEIEEKLNEILNYVPGELYKELQDEILDFMFDHISFLSNFWNSRYYKIGFIDGMNVKKDVERELEELSNGKSDE